MMLKDAESQSLISQVFFLNNNDIVLHVMEFLGPRHNSIGIGSTCKHLCNLSRSDPLWKSFWLKRCLFYGDNGSKIYIGDRYGTDLEQLVHRSSQERHAAGDQTPADALPIHREAIVFRHAIQSMELTPHFQRSKDEQHDDRDDHTLFSAYVRTHFMVKLTNLRVDISGDGSFSTVTNSYSSLCISNTFVGNPQTTSDESCHTIGNKSNGDVENNPPFKATQLNQMPCTQSWPGRLSEVNQVINATVDENGNITSNTNTLNSYQINNGGNGNRRERANNNNNNHVLCLNPAEVWCDYPTCNQARCGKQGCLRSYRFNPASNNRNSVSTERNQTSAFPRLCSDRSYETLEFVKCSFCSVSFCTKHACDYFREREDYCRLNHISTDENLSFWHECVECKLLACMDCVSQVFVSPPNAEGCQIVKSGRVCQRVVCRDCIWYVRKNNLESANNTPTVVSRRGRDLAPDNILGNEVETCCSRCKEMVESRMKEIVQIQNSFGGLLP